MKHLPKPANIFDIERAAMHNLSNFDGQRGVSAEVLSRRTPGYNGAADDFLNFGNSSGFDKEVDESRIFQFSVVSSSNKTENFFLNDLFRQMFNEDSSVVKDGNFYSENPNVNNEDDPIRQLTGVGITGSISDFLLHVQRNPTRVLGFKVSSSADAQIQSMSVKVSKYNPFGEAKQEAIIYPNAYVNENTYRDKVVTVPVGFQMDDQTIIKTSLVAGATVTFTLLCGAILNPAAALAHKAERAGLKK
jgi:hypothetical protein